MDILHEGRPALRHRCASRALAGRIVALDGVEACAGTRSEAFPASRAMIAAIAEAS
ncbi:hypothetical protein [Rubrimonas cliftonensis]|uniref:Uncharacterized protein n=1 Tax=Rubrimonas cliftonensis TaxID=89524 RepID=A0A1H4FD61_9RHOB|nr:hypothetical protein [Rubrimonas cliftonensis]SEA95205.1 hypothetical protein SAMN05444370_12110 [Rubrimonas cliftonensis]